MTADLLLTVLTGLTALPLVIVTESGVGDGLVVAFDAREEINQITSRFLQIGQGIAAGIAALAILAGFIMIATSHGSNARAENGRQAVIAGLTGLVGVAVVSGLVEIVTEVFPRLR